MAAHADLVGPEEPDRPPQRRAEVLLAVVAREHLVDPADAGAAGHAQLGEVGVPADVEVAGLVDVVVGDEMLDHLQQVVHRTLHIDVTVVSGVVGHARRGGARG